jgi:hypothetical protein
MAASHCSESFAASRTARARSIRVNAAAIGFEMEKRGRKLPISLWFIPRCPAGL